MTLVAEIALVFTVQVPAEALTEQETDPEAAEPQVTTDGLAAVPFAPQSEVVANRAAFSVPDPFPHAVVSTETWLALPLDKPVSAAAELFAVEDH